MVRRLDKRQADRLFEIVKIVAEGFEDARQPLTLKAAEGKSVYHMATRKKLKKHSKRGQA